MRDRVKQLRFDPLGLSGGRQLRDRVKQLRFDPLGLSGSRQLRDRVKGPRFDPLGLVRSRQLRYWIAQLQHVWLSPFNWFGRFGSVRRQ